MQCATCEKESHVSCNSLRKSIWEKMSAEQRGRLKCVACKKEVNIESLLQDLKKDILKEIGSVKNKLADLKSKVAEIENAMAFFNDKFEENKTEMKKIDTVLNTAVKKIEALEDENREMKLAAKRNAAEIVLLQQRSRIQNIEIQGVPEGRDEKCVDIICDIAKTLQLDVVPADINIAHRTKTAEGKIRPIVANIYSRCLKQELIVKAKKKKGIDSKTVTSLSTFPASKIYVGDHLCPANKILLAKAKAAANEKNRLTI